MGRKRQVGRGTSSSSHVRAFAVFNQPLDRRKLAQAVLALVLAEATANGQEPEEATDE